MTEPAKQLDAAIRDLEAHLRQVENLDPASRQLLTEAVAGIQAKLRAQDPTTPSWSGRLTSAIVDLEASNPGLATMVTRVCDFLDQAGI
jgi:Domain of unknown function (DUF4404)